MTKLMRTHAPDECEKIIKFGVPIGSAIEGNPIGLSVHPHNLKSHYLSTYTLDYEFTKSE